jgi:hypothetical protein
LYNQIHFYFLPTCHIGYNWLEETPSDASATSQGISLIEEKTKPKATSLPTLTKEAFGSY